MNYKMSRKEALATGHTIDDCCNPPVAYKGARFNPSVWFHVPTEEVEELERENEALRKDAERYRFLKDQNDDKHNQFVEKIAARHYGLEWDSIIDAAMKGQ